MKIYQYLFVFLALAMVAVQANVLDDAKNNIEGGLNKVKADFQAALDKIKSRFGGNKA